MAQRRPSCTNVVDDLADLANNIVGRVGDAPIRIESREVDHLVEIHQTTFDTRCRCQLRQPVADEVLRVGVTERVAQTFLIDQDHGLHVDGESIDVECWASGSAASRVGTRIGVVGVVDANTQQIRAGRRGALIRAHLNQVRVHG